jgi:hypothetical protein
MRTKSVRIFAFCMLTLFLYQCGDVEETTMLTIKNTTSLDVKDFVLFIDQVTLANEEITAGLLWPSFWNGKVQLPAQQIVQNGEMKWATILDLQPDQSIELKIKWRKVAKNEVFPKRTHAELAIKTGGEWKEGVYENGQGFIFVDSLRVPDELTDHSYYIKYEGPGWESDKVAYRFYLDWRNAVDIFGKLTTDMVLPEVGLNNFDSYHELNAWGMDLLKVGSSLGIGSVATWNGRNAERVAQTDSVICTIEADGVLYSCIRTRYFNWKSSNGTVDLDSRISIVAGSRMTRQELRFNGALNNLATGIVKFNDIPLIKGPADTKWGYIATWGQQSLNSDNLGMVVFFKNREVLEITADEHSYVVVLDPAGEYVEYYYAAVWEKESGKNITEADFIRYIEESITLLDNPIAIVE